ncbi:hypothetical protein JTB14_017204 [Gonioctena quinquepunctata]|nr:hypothetical protein JTB14_017204 [Gonioctena quinquepunctata]
MKCLVFFVVLVCACWAVPLTKEEHEKLSEIHRNCQEKSGVDKALIKLAVQGQFPDDPKFKEYSFCTSQKFGFQNELGEFQNDVMRKNILAHGKVTTKLDEIIDKCTIQKESPAESAFNYYKCYQDINGKLEPEFFAVPLSKEKQEHLSEIHRNCQEKSGVDKALIKLAVQGQFPDDPKFKQYSFCTSQKFGFQNELGEFQNDVMRKNILEYGKVTTKLDEIIDKCTIQRESPAESAYNYYKCYYETNGKLEPEFFSSESVDKDALGKDVK